jgi:hypothetical protein
MKPRSAFSEAKPRSAKGNVRLREQLANEKVDELLSMGDEASFIESISIFGIKHGEPRFEAALAAWRESQKRP